MTATRIHVFGYATGDGGAQLAPSGNPHTVSAETASRLISAGLARAASQSPLAMPFYAARISADEVPAFTEGWPGVIYVLDRPPYTWYRWDGSSLVELASSAAAPPPPPPPPAPSPIPDGALAISSGVLAIPAGILVFA